MLVNREQSVCLVKWPKFMLTVSEPAALVIVQHSHTSDVANCMCAPPSLLLWRYT